MPHPPRSRDRLDDDHMTAEVHRRMGELGCDRRQGDRMTSEGEALKKYARCMRKLASH